ncbi:MAG: ATP-binding protein [Solirubrobacterales bacterium]
MLAPEEFRREFPGESQYIEFKRGVGKDTLQDSIVAFSNADGGVILIGVTDDGVVQGRQLDSGTADAIHQILHDIHNPGRYFLHQVEVDGRPVIALGVARRQEGFAQQSNGIVRIRKGSRDEALFGPELQHLVNERSANRFELTPTQLKIEDANAEQLAAFGEAFGWSKAFLADRLSEMGYASEGRLTIAGALYLVNDPGKTLGKSHIELLRYRDDDSVDYDLRIELDGPLPSQLEAAVERVLEELGTELVVLGVRRYELRRIPPVVLREAVANALAHRSYELDRTAVRIEIRPAAIKVISPGGLPEPVTVENIRETSAPRNLAVIGALRRYGLAEDAGRGIDVMEDKMLEEMLDPPVIEDRGHSVVVTLPVRSAVAPDERAWIQELERRGTLRGPDRLVLVHAARGEVLTNAKVREILQTDEATAREILQRLRDARFLVQRGKRGGATYHLEGSLAPPAGLRLNQDELLSLIEGLAEEGPISNADARAATGLERSEIRALLASLVRNGRLIQRGERRGTRYLLPPTPS